MGKQKGPLFITGTYNGICYYEMDGEYYFRKASSLSGKRVKRDPSFALTMTYAGILGQAAIIASEVYRMLSPGLRERSIYRAMTSRANQSLKLRTNVEALKALLIEEFITTQHVGNNVHITTIGDGIAGIPLSTGACDVTATHAYDCKPARASEVSVAKDNAAKHRGKLLHKAIRILSHRQAKQPLLHNRKGRLYVSTKGLVGNIIAQHKIVMAPGGSSAKWMDTCV